jgi:hypothetical protein
MNERIKALLLNARNMFVNGVTESDNKIYIHGSEENLEKFAELIVLECVEQVITGPNGPAHYAVEAALRLKKHFGVEL